MIFIKKKNNFKILYIFFITFSINIFFFSTTKVFSKSCDINNVEISKPFEINFDKNQIIDEGFKKAFNQLVGMVVKSSDKLKLRRVGLNEIKGMIESFSIKEEKFIDEIYHVNLGVSFNKKKFFNFFEKKNIFPTIPQNQKFLFIPIIINEKTKDLLIFSDNKIFQNWNKKNNDHHLIDYILPTEDLEDISLIKNKFNKIENYDFKEIISKYYLDHSIIVLIFKDGQDLRVLSRITIKDNVNLKNQSFENFDLNDDQVVENLVEDLKEIYEDFWKNLNIINTSIKFPLIVKVKNKNNDKISMFEENLNQLDLIYDYYIYKLDKDYTFYHIIFNGSPDIFIKKMNEKNFSLDTQNKTWVLE